MLPGMHVAKVIGLWFRVWVLVLCVAGPLLLAISLASTIYTEAYLHRCTATTGTIVQNVAVREQHQNGSVTINYAPVFRYTADDGHTYTVTSSISTNPPEFAVLQQVSVLYVHGVPGSGKIDSFLQLWTGPMVAAGLGVVTSAVGYTLLFVLRRRKMRLIPTIAHS